MWLWRIFADLHEARHLKSKPSPEISPGAVQRFERKAWNSCGLGKLPKDLLIDLILNVQEANEVSIGHWCWPYVRLGGRAGQR